MEIDFKLLMVLKLISIFSFLSLFFHDSANCQNPLNFFGVDDVLTSLGWELKN